MQGGGTSGKTWSSPDNEEERESAQIFWVKGIKGYISDLNICQHINFFLYCDIEWINKAL